MILQVDVAFQISFPACPTHVSVCETVGEGAARRTHALGPGCTPHPVAPGAEDGRPGLVPGVGLSTLAPLCPQAFIFAAILFLFVAPEILACLLMTPRRPSQNASTRTHHAGKTLQQSWTQMGSTSYQLHLTLSRKPTSLSSMSSASNGIDDGICLLGLDEGETACDRVRHKMGAQWAAGAPRFSLFSDC